MNTFIIGTGLIGGSFAKDLKRLRPDVKIFGIDTNATAFGRSPGFKDHR